MKLSFTVAGFFNLFQFENSSKHFLFQLFTTCHRDSQLWKIQHSWNRHIEGDPLFASSVSCLIITLWGIRKSISLVEISLNECRSPSKKNLILQINIVFEWYLESYNHLNKYSLTDFSRSLEMVDENMQNKLSWSNKKNNSLKY